MFRLELVHQPRSFLLVSSSSRIRTDVKIRNIFLETVNDKFTLITKSLSKPCSVEHLKGQGHVM